jgi:hypothetical protein
VWEWRVCVIRQPLYLESPGPEVHVETIRRFQIKEETKTRVEEFVYMELERYPKRESDLSTPLLQLFAQFFFSKTDPIFMEDQ